MPFGAGAEDAIGAHQPHAHDVHQGVARVLGGEGDLPAHRRTAETVAVPADARHHALDEVPRLRITRVAEAQGVEEGDGPRPHGEDVAEDPSDPGGRALERLDERRVVVALDLEHHGPAIPDVDGARVFSRTLEDAGTRLGQAAQEGPRVLVGAVLGPQRGEEPDLGIGRGAPQAGDDARVLLGRQPELVRELGGDRGRGLRGDG